jgi:hypothetical protein
MEHSVHYVHFADTCSMITEYKSVRLWKLCFPSFSSCLLKIFTDLSDLLYRLSVALFHRVMVQHYLQHIADQGVLVRAYVQ